jgi:uncharacterized protein YdhG (YjbR/CyaY superfamily)
METKSKASFKTPDEYIGQQPENARNLLRQLRQIIKDAAPQAEEVISYRMPAFKYHGMLVYYAAFKNHYSLFPMTKALEKFKTKLAGYETTKGTIHFSYDRPVPVKLVTEIVQYRIKENLEKQNAREIAKKKKPKK